MISLCWIEHLGVLDVGIYLVTPETSSGQLILIKHILESSRNLVGHLLLLFCVVKDYGSILCTPVISLLILCSGIMKLVEEFHQLFVADLVAIEAQM